MKLGTMYGENQEAKAIHVMHSTLKPWGDGESAYRVVCPACNDGALMVARDQTTLALVNVDRCIRCAQVVIYDDTTINDEPVTKVAMSVEG